MLSNLAADRARIAGIAARILYLEDAIAELRAEQVMMQERIDSYKYPVLTLPNEIVSEIFIRFLPAYPVFHPPVGKDSPALLTQICRRWREIALATPDLWRVIALCHSQILTGQHLICISRAPPISAWLRQSGSCPLSIIMNEYNISARVSEAIISTLAQSCARWQHAKLQFRHSVRFIDTPMPLLQHLDLALSSPTILWGQHDLPQLRSAVLNRFAAASVNLPWDQLTSLALGDVKGFERRRCLAILQQTPMLVHCTLDLSAHQEFTDDIRVILPCLRSLVFISKTTYRYHRVQPLTDILPSLIVPALFELIVPEPFLGFDPIGSLTSFISTSGCKLHEMHITAKTSQSHASHHHYRTEFPCVAISFSAHWEVPADGYHCD